MSDFKNAHREIMENSIPVMRIIAEINKVVNDIEGTNDKDLQKQAIREFYEKADLWQIIVTKPEDTYIWMQIPIIYHESEREAKLSERIKFFFKRGIWIEPKIIEKYADILSNVTFPMEMELEPMDFIYAKSNEIEEFYYSVVYLLGKIITAMMKAGSEEIAIYNKPDGIIAMNQVNYWLEEVNKQGLANTGHLQNTLKTATISELLKDATIEMVGVEEYMDN